MKRWLLGALGLLVGCTASPEPSTPTTPTPEVWNAPGTPPPQVIWITPHQVRLPRDKTVLILVGAPWCRWCHYMQESFANPEVAQYVNEKFYPIYIDATKHPKLANILNPDRSIPALVLFRTSDILALPGLKFAHIDTITSKGYLAPPELLSFLRSAAMIYEERGTRTSLSEFEGLPEE